MPSNAIQPAYSHARGVELFDAGAYDVLPSLPGGSCAAVVSMPSSLGLYRGRQLRQGEVPTFTDDDLAWLVREFGRLAGPGPIIVASIYNPERWEAVLASAGYLVQRVTLIGTVEVVAARRPKQPELTLPIPAESPFLSVALAEIVEAVSAEGETVIDPFCSTHLIARAAIATGRTFVGVVPRGASLTDVAESVEQDLAGRQHALPHHKRRRGADAD